MKVFLLVVLTAPLAAQTIRVTSLETATPLNGEWREQTSDDSRCADPGFDDSSWSRITMPRAIAPGAYGYTWHRIHLEIPATDRPVSSAIAPLFPAYEIFANGVKIGSFGGELGSPWGQYSTRLASFPLPKGQPRLMIAIRSSELGMTFGRKKSDSLLAGTFWLGTLQREFFGFDRTREMSGKSTQEIADAAQAWGQNDDITVVTVTMET